MYLLVICIRFGVREDKKFEFRHYSMCLYAALKGHEPIFFLFSLFYEVLYYMY